MAPQWEGIEDSAEDANPVWLSRELPDTANLFPFDPTPERAQGFVSNADAAARAKIMSGWSPLRKDDCRSLNAALEEWQENASAFENAEPQILIDNGRSTAFLEQGVIRYNFTRGPARALWPAVWFYRMDSREIVPVLSMEDAALMEELYLRFLKASSNASTLASMLNNATQNCVILKDEKDSKAVVEIENGKLIMRKMSVMAGVSGFFQQAPVVLQRGYGSYEVPGEKDESELGPLRHVVFVIHGMTGSHVDGPDPAPLLRDMENMRTSLYSTQMEQWRKEKGETRPFRTEFIPIEWYQTWKENSKELMETLGKATLSSIPGVRDTMRDGAMDMLFYLTPDFTQLVLESVAEMINKVYDRLLSLFPEFEEKGAVHLVGHSLGSVIAWDLLTILKEQETGISSGTWGPGLTSPLSQPLPFRPYSVVLLGSPLGMFLTLRGAQDAFDELRQEEFKSEEIAKPTFDSVNYKVCPFALPCDRFLHVFHRSDPQAYRIESLLLSPDVPQSDIPPPRYLVKPGEDVRINVKVAEVGLLRAMFGALSSSPVQDDDEYVFPLGGKSTRVDFCLQPGVMEHDYLAIPTANVSYWANSDVVDCFTTLFQMAEKESGDIEADPERLEI